LGNDTLGVDIGWIPEQTTDPTSMRENGGGDSLNRSRARNECT
jgi:hypothetical protein